MPEVSGTTLIRRALNQAHRRSIPALARELGISVLALEAFRRRCWGQDCSTTWPIGSWVVELPTTTTRT